MPYVCKYIIATWWITGVTNVTFLMKKQTVILYIVQMLVFIVQVLQVFLINDHDCVLQ